MSQTGKRPVSTALSRLRLSTTIFLWMIGLALTGQIIVWSLAAFTDLRFDAAEEQPEAPLLVQSEQENSGSLRHRHRRDGGIGIERSPDPPADEQNADAAAPKEAGPPTGRIDRQFEQVVNVGAMLGRCAIIIMLPLVALGVILCACFAVPGIEKAVSALLWALVLAILVLPLGQALDLPWNQGALYTYDHLTEAVDARALAQQDEGETAAADEPSGTPAAGEIHAQSTAAFFARFLVMPLAAIIGCVLVGFRFGAGVEAGISPDDSMRLDPAIEREASNINPTSLHGGRSGSALDRAIARQPSDEQKSMPTARSVSPGEAPKRLI